MATVAVRVGTRPREGATARLVRLVTRGPVNVVLVAVALLWLVPSVGLLVTSFRTVQDYAESGWWKVFTVPSQLTVENYRRLLDNPEMLRSFGNTVLITVPSSLLVVLIAALAAYAFAWGRFPGRDALFLVLVGLLVVPLQIALIPVAKLYSVLKIYGTIPGVVLFHVAFGLPFAIFLLRNFFIGIPHELLEAARMDGAGELRIFLRVVLPLGLPAIASLLIFQFMWVWNDLLVALVFASPRSAPLTLFIQSNLRAFGSNVDIISSGAFLQLVVPLVVFFAFQRYFVQGILAGSVK
ncbi:MAG TPA: carbohydrate ABC transporter permease [Actinomycetota bacterium]|nr:carbohydrate ABC transporter permease [Actinomycetota bacterium]